MADIKLTPEQTKKAEEYRDRWYEIGVDCGLADRPNAEAAWNAWYKHANQEEPQMIWVDSPLAVQMIVNGKSFTDNDHDFVRELIANLKSIQEAAHTPINSSVLEGADVDFGKDQVALVTSFTFKADIALEVFDSLADAQAQQAEYAANQRGVDLSAICTDPESLAAAVNNCQYVVEPAAEMATYENGESATLLQSLLEWMTHVGFTAANIADDSLSPAEAKQVAWMYLPRLEERVLRVRQTSTPAWFLGSLSAPWMGFYTFVRDEFQPFSDEQLEQLTLFDQWVKAGFVAFPYEDQCYLCEKPSEINWGENAGGDQVLHNETGPAVAFRDGYGVYSIGGVTVPKKIVEAPETITIEEIRSEDNAEVKRLMTEAYGYGKYLTDVNASIIDQDTVAVDKLVPEGKHIMRALMQDDENNRFLVGSDGSTHRVYYMPVPADTQTCEAAAEMLANGLKSENCISES